MEGILKMRLTKKQLGQLELGCILDDTLHEKYQRMMQDVYREHKRLVRDQSRISRVLLRQKDGVFRTLRIVRIETGEWGTHVIVSE